MTAADTLPSHHLRLLRHTARELLRPDRIASEMTVATLLASINTCVAIADEYEEETAVLRSLVASRRLDRSAFRVVAGQNDEGEAP